MNILFLIGSLICKHIGLWVKISMELRKTYIFKLEVNDLDLVMIFDTLKCMWGGHPIHNVNDKIGVPCIYDVSNI